MAFNNRNGTYVGEELDGQMWNGFAWIVLVENEDNPVTGGSGSTSTGTNVVHLSAYEVCASQTIPEENFTVDGNIVLRHQYRTGVSAYRIVMANNSISNVQAGESIYTFERPTSITGGVITPAVVDVIDISNNAAVGTISVPVAFRQLNDTPNSYTGRALNTLRVNAAANGLEFVAPVTAPTIPMEMGLSISGNDASTRVGVHGTNDLPTFAPFPGRTTVRFRNTSTGHQVVNSTTADYYVAYDPSTNISFVESIDETDSVDAPGTHIVVVYGDATTFTTGTTLLDPDIPAAEVSTVGQFIILSTSLSAGLVSRFSLVNLTELTSRTILQQAGGGTVSYATRRFSEFVASGTWTKPEGLTEFDLTLAPGGSATGNHFLAVSKFRITNQPSAATNYAITVGGAGGGSGGISRFAGNSLNLRSGQASGTFTETLTASAAPNAQITANITSGAPTNGVTIPIYDKDGNPRSILGTGAADVGGLVRMDW